MTKSLHKELQQRKAQLQKQKIEQMHLQKQKIERWKKKISKQYANKQRSKPEKIRILPWNTKQRITLADKLIAEIICPINQRLYYVFWNLK